MAQDEVLEIIAYTPWTEDFEKYAKA